MEEGADLLQCFYTRGSYDALHGTGALEALMARHSPAYSSPSSAPAAHSPAIQNEQESCEDSN
jgi:hypothetical protein